MKHIIILCIIISALFCSVAHAEESAEPENRTVKIEDSSDYSLKGHWFVGVAFSFSILTDRTDSSYFAETVGGSFTAGYGMTQNLTLLLRVEQNGWHNEEYNNNWNSGVFNIGVGLDYQMFAPYVHLSFIAGPSILTSDTQLDKAGSVGIFMEISPVELVWIFDDHWRLSVSGLSLHIDIPVTHDPVLRYVQYRTSVGISYIL